MVKPERPSQALRGRDLEALQSFAKKLREALPDVVRELRFLGVRTVDSVPPRAAAPEPPPPDPSLSEQEQRKRLIRPLPKPPSALRVAVLLERRDVLAEDVIDRLCSEISLELGTAVCPQAYSALEWKTIMRAASVSRRFEVGEVLP
ncbi:MAG: hypothetical protein ACYS22_04825 [Planctomycetota bacterium]